MEAVDCQPDFCLDLFEPSGHGRRRRAISDQTSKNHSNAVIDYTRFKENIEYSVMLPGEYDQMRYQDPEQCKNFILISGLLALLLTMSTILVNYISLCFIYELKSPILTISFLTFELQSCALVTKIQNYSRKTIDDFIPTKGYAGRAVLQ